MNFADLGNRAFRHIYIYMVAPPPLIHIFWPLQPTQAGLAQHLHTRGRAPLNVHAAPKFLGHLGFGDSKD